MSRLVYHMTLHLEVTFCNVLKVLSHLQFTYLVTLCNDVPNNTACTGLDKQNFLT